MIDMKSVSFATVKIYEITNLSNRSRASSYVTSGLAIVNTEVNETVTFQARACIGPEFVVAALYDPGCESVRLSVFTTYMYVVRHKL